MELTRSSQVRITGTANAGKVDSLLGLLARVSGPITDQTQKFLNDFRVGIKVAPMPQAADNTCLMQFSGLIKRALCKNNHPYSRIAPGTPVMVEPELTG